MWQYGCMTHLQVSGLDHIVLNVADVEKSLAFYCGELGLEPVRVEEWRQGKAPFPSARINGSTIVDFMNYNRTGENLNHFALVVENTDLAELAISGQFEVIDGPGPRFGARGEGTGLYIHDPDRNVVELRSYP